MQPPIIQECNYYQSKNAIEHKQQFRQVAAIIFGILSQQKWCRIGCNIFRIFLAKFSRLVLHKNKVKRLFVTSDLFLLFPHCKAKTFWTPACIVQNHWFVNFMDCCPYQRISFKSRCFLKHLQGFQKCQVTLAVKNMDLGLW